MTAAAGAGLLNPFDPWLWLGLAALLALAEILIPGYLLLGFALAALIAAGVVALIAPPLLWLILGWSTLALAIWWALARRAGGKARRHGGDCDINDFRNH